jgi:crotonobetainyl-CoA:carnitine CoA-transferase CaiB-like acyl-CoA transferase
VNRAIKFPEDRQPVPTAPPVLGQHTDEILRDVLGLTAERILNQYRRGNDDALVLVARHRGSP